MDVSSTAAAGQPAATTPISSDANKSTLDYNSFLTLLIAQIKNQDPTNPPDSAQFVAQLASFSSVEQAVKMNSKMDELLTNLALSQADSVIGHTVTSVDGSLSGKATSLRVVTGGAVAVLDNGQEIPLGSGVVIS